LPHRQLRAAGASECAEKTSRPESTNASSFAGGRKTGRRCLQSSWAARFSKLERGIALAPLFAYLGIADAFEIPPGRLLGPDDAFKELDAAEATLIAVIRETGVSPAEAIVRIVGSSSG
jgi:hypothetical protein